MSKEQRLTKVMLPEVGEVVLVAAGPLTRKLVKMVQNNGIKFTENWMDTRGLHSRARGLVYNNQQKRLVETIDQPLREFLIGLREGKLYHILDFFE